MDIPPKNEFISVDTLETYIEKYPEDAEKWLEFIRGPVDEEPAKLRRTRYTDKELNEDLYKTNSDLHNVESDVPIEHFNDGCLFCKKSWVSTDGVPTTTLICGHKFHTLCSMIDQYNGDTTRCIVDECDIDTWDYVRKIVRSKEKAKTKSENILLESLKNRKDFKESLKDLKQQVSNVTSKYNSVRGMIVGARKEFIHKHLYSLNQIQNDLNEGVKYIRDSENMHKYKEALRIYRKKASTLFRKYHISFRELRERGLLRASWRLRYVLERHSSPFSYYKMGIRMYPGKKIWKDTLEQSDDEDDAMDIPPAMMRAGLERLEQDDQDDQENI